MPAPGVSRVTALPGQWRTPLLLTLAAIGLFLLECSGLDDLVSRLFFDPTQGAFPQRRSWLFNVVLHDRARWLFGLTGVVSGTLLAASLVVPRFRWFRSAALFILVSLLLSTGAVAAIKASSAVACPWDLQAYGGVLERVPPPGIFGSDQAGKCWPSGHAAGGFCLLAFYFGLRRRWPRTGAVALALAIGCGGIFSLSQTVRGAHFISHGLWTGLIIWSINLLLLRLPVFEPLRSLDQRIRLE